MNSGGIKIIKASAGSGKTYMLARTYIANLIGIPTGKYVKVEDKELECFKLRKGFEYHRHILAITFTNKATNEMKERIITQLYELGNGEGDYVEDFKAMFAEDDFADVIVAARRALSAILFDYASFNVSTIDSFFQSILRNFARELDRDYNYSLELDEDYATSVAVHDFLLDLGGINSKQRAIDDWVKEFIRTNITENKSWDFFGKNSSEELEKFAKYIFKESFRDHHEKIVDYLSDIGSGNGKSKVLRFKQHLIARRNFRKQSITDAQNELHIFCVNNGLQQDYFDRRKPLYKISGGDMSPFESDSSWKTLKKYSEEDSALTGTLKGKYSKLANDDRCLEFKNLLQQVFKNYDMVEFLDDVIANIWKLGLLGKIDEKLEEYRKDTNSIMIADTNELIGKVLDCGATFIYEHAGTAINNYMIDEFQDTSRKQYDNFKPLLEESIARANENLIIGDEKQSIYRFRNSDPSMLREEIQNDFELVDVESLDTNYRSSPVIVDFNNNLFDSVINAYQKDAPQYTSLSETYKNIKQKVNKTNKEGFVSLNVVTYSGNNIKSAKHKIITTLPNLINSLRSRGYDMKDIAILVNTNDEGNDIVEHLLQYNDSLGGDNQAEHIDIVSAESLLLKNSPSIRLIISVLQFLELTQYQFNEEDGVGTDSMLAGSLKKRISEQRRYKILHDFEAKIQFVDAGTNTGKTLLECFGNDRESASKLSQEKRLATYSAIAQEVMPDPTNQLTNLVNIVDKIISKYILPSGDEDSDRVENSFLLAFMNVVLNFTRQHNGGTVREFLQYWDEKKDKLAVSSPADANAVSVMTIHKSKGLEFKCVIVPFVCWDLIHDDKLFWIKKSDWEDAGPIEDIGINDRDIIPPLIPVKPSAIKKSGYLKEILDKEEEKSLIDNLNKLYVALTRPKDELYLFMPLKQSSLNSISGLSTASDAGSLLLSFVHSNVDARMGFAMNEQQLDCWEIGSPNENETDSDVVNKVDVINFNMGRQVMIEHDESKETKNKSNVMSNYYVSTKVMPVHISMHNASGAVKVEGLRMHELFSLVKNFDDFEFARQYGIANGLFEGNRYWNQERFIQLVNKIESDARLMDWFASDNVIYSERNISFPHSKDSDDHEHRRPDRIIKRADGELVVVDYKFGVKTDADTVADHSSKVREYMSLLKQLGNDRISGFLWYMRYNKIVPISF